MGDSRKGPQCQCRGYIPCMVVKVLLLGEDLHQNQWCVEYDDEISALYAKVKEERKDEKYIAALGDAVKALLAHYAPSADDDGSDGAEGEPEATRGELLMDEWQTHDM